MPRTVAAESAPTGLNVRLVVLEAPALLAEQRNSRKKGDAGLGAAIAFFTARGDTVSVPLTDSQEYDLIVDEDGVLKKVQVKATTRSRKGAFEVWLRGNGGGCRSNNYTMKPFDWHEIDYVFVLCGDGSQWFIPADELEHNATSVSVGGGRREHLRVA